MRPPTAIAVPGTVHGSRADEAGEIGSVLEPFLLTVVKLANAYAGAVRSLTPDGCRLRLVAAVGLPDEALRHETLVGFCGVCGEAARGADVRVASDPAGCDKLAFEGYFGKPHSGTVAVPLEYKGQRVGVFTLFVDGVDRLRPEVIHLLRPIGELVGLALENARLQRETVRARLEQERRAMACEIHDALAQSLTFARMRMLLLDEAIRAEDRPRALGYCADVNDELGQANRRVRELITHFRTGLDAPALHGALTQIASRFQAQTGIALDFQCKAPELALGESHDAQVYHIVREALANVRKHSGARHASVRVERVGDSAVITIEDDGTGLRAREQDGDAGDAAAHVGLDIMRQRAEAVGGRLELEEIASGGTRVRLTFPVELPHEEARG